MTLQIAVVITLTFVINLISTLALGVRIVGLRTRKWSVSYSLFNVMSLVARFANMLQAPLLAKTIERNINLGRTEQVSDFRWIMLGATLATVTGGLLFPSFQRLLTRGVELYYDHRSIPKLLFYSAKRQTIQQIPAYLKWPDRQNWHHLLVGRNVSWSLLVMNALASALLTVGVLATLYAGYLNPSLRSTAASMSGLVNGVSLLLLIILIDPDIALLSDEVVAGRFSVGYFRRYIIWTLVARIVGTLAAQALLMPMAYMIIWLAERLG